MSEPTDDALMVLVQQRDKAAFAELASRHVSGLHRYATRFGGADQADDLVQETLLRLWERASRYKARRSKPSTWLYRLTHNLCIDAHRRESVRTVVRAGGVSATDDADGTVGNDDTASLNTALATLPESQRSALLLTHLNGFSNRQVADIISSSERAVESLLARGRRNLRRALETQGGAER